jgi:integrase/recombinase XerD
MDIHNYNKQFQRTLERIKESVDFSKENKKIAVEFKDYLLSENIGLSKINRYMLDLMKYNKMLGKGFSEANKDDLRRVIADLNQTDLAEETKKCFKIMLRKLYRFIRGVENPGEYPDEVKWISIRITENHKKLPEELLTDEEIINIIQKTERVRDRALLSSLAESGCRISEIGTMQIKHISFEEYGTRLMVNGKTGMRKILVINCTPYLQEWINQHPYNDNPESYLWISSNGEILSYTRIAAILKESVKKAGIKKRVYPHLFRHSRATLLANVMSDSALKNYLGWTQGSKMAATYIHMSGKETDNSILELNGVKIDKEKKISKLKPKECSRCKTINEATNRFCKICGLPLDQETRQEIIKVESEKKDSENLMEELVKDEDIVKLLVKKIIEKGLYKGLF